MATGFGAISRAQSDGDDDAGRPARRKHFSGWAQERPQSLHPARPRPQGFGATVRADSDKDDDAGRRTRRKHFPG
eukprot:1493279-Alexandrium_andersonii.AAC.1